jgi:hypothetical protein
MPHENVETNLLITKQTAPGQYQGSPQGGLSSFKGPEITEDRAQDLSRAPLTGDNSAPPSRSARCKRFALASQ